MTVINISTQTSYDYLSIFSASDGLVAQYSGYLGVTNYIHIIWDSPFVRFNFTSDASVVSTGIILNFTIGNFIFPMIMFAILLLNFE